MTSFLKRVWATIVSLPVIAAGLAASVTAVSSTIADQLPDGPAQQVTHWGIVAAAVILAGGAVVRLVTPVAKDLRGFPKASLSDKAKLLKEVADLKASLAEAEAQYQRDVHAYAPLPPPITTTASTAPDDAPAIYVDPPA